MSEPRENRERDAILEAVAFAAALLHSPTDLDDAVGEVLGGLGSALSVSRSYLFRNRALDGHLVADLTHEWVAPGVAPQLEEPALHGVAYEGMFGRWREELSRGRSIHDRVENLPPVERDFLAAQDIRSLIVTPIRVADRWWGFLGLDDCTDGRIWSDAVLRVLNVAADTLGAALHRRDLESALAVQRKRIETGQRLEALGRLAGGVAHDFNNVLTAIGAHLELIAEDVGPGVRAEIDDVRGYVRHGADLARQLLAFGRQQPLEPRVVDIAALILSLEPLLRRFAANGRCLRLDLPESGGAVARVDPSQLQQVVTNLVVNAFDAVGRTGTVCVRVQDVPGPMTVIEVVDDGSGIPPEIRDRIFEPFFSTKGEAGTGLGLATVYGIVQQSGGTIECRSLVGEGTTFRIELPRA